MLPLTDRDESIDNGVNTALRLTRLSPSRRRTALVQVITAGKDCLTQREQS
jgi:hypothetical protein